MKKSNKFLVWIGLTLVFGLLATILFLTVPDARLDTAVFWLAFAFSLPFNFVVASVVYLWAILKNNEEVRMPIVYGLVSTFGLIYIASGALFMYLGLTNVVFPLIVELVITVAYALAIMYFLRAGEYIVKSEKETKKKVLYIRLLQASVEECRTKTTNAQISASLSALSENVRFSDPMSHESLVSVEMELMDMVDKIGSALTSGDDETATTLIQQAQAKLEYRNNRCLLLK